MRADTLHPAPFTPITVPTITLQLEDRCQSLGGLPTVTQLTRGQTGNCARLYSAASHLGTVSRRVLCPAARQGLPPTPTPLHTQRWPYSGSEWPAPSCWTKAKNASFSSGSASSGTGKLVAAESLLEDSGLFLWSLWVLRLEPKTFSAGQRGQEAAECGWAQPPDLALALLRPLGK